MSKPKVYISCPVSEPLSKIEEVADLVRNYGGDPGWWPRGAPYNSTCDRIDSEYYQAFVFILPANKWDMDRSLLSSGIASELARARSMYEGEDLPRIHIAYKAKDGILRLYQARVTDRSICGISSTTHLIPETWKQIAQEIEEGEDLEDNPPAPMHTPRGTNTFPVSTQYYFEDYKFYKTDEERKPLSYTEMISNTVKSLVTKAEKDVNLLLKARICIYHDWAIERPHIKRNRDNSDQFKHIDGTHFWTNNNKLYLYLGNEYMGEVHPNTAISCIQEMIEDCQKAGIYSAERTIELDFYLSQIRQFDRDKTWAVPTYSQCEAIYGPKTSYWPMAYRKLEPPAPVAPPDPLPETIGLTSFPVSFAYYMTGADVYHVKDTEGITKLVFENVRKDCITHLSKEEYPHSEGELNNFIGLSLVLRDHVWSEKRPTFKRGELNLPRFSLAGPIWEADGELYYFVGNERFVPINNLKNLDLAFSDFWIAVSGMNLPSRIKMVAQQWQKKYEDWKKKKGYPLSEGQLGFGFVPYTEEDEKDRINQRDIATLAVKASYPLETEDYDRRLLLFM